MNGESQLCHTVCLQLPSRLSSRPLTWFQSDARFDVKLALKVLPPDVLIPRQLVPPFAGLAGAHNVPWFQRQKDLPEHGLRNEDPRRVLAVLDVLVLVGTATAASDATRPNFRIPNVGSSHLGRIRRNGTR